jgi:hypothetical protein
MASFICADSDQKLKIRAADAKEVGMGNPAEKTSRHPNNLLCQRSGACQSFSANLGCLVMAVCLNTSNQTGQFMPAENGTA